MRLYTPILKQTVNLILRTNFRTNLLLIMVYCITILTDILGIFQDRFTDGESLERAPLDSLKAIVPGQLENAIYVVRKSISVTLAKNARENSHPLKNR